ncbi:flavin oxidoreductase nadh oxidase, partial [Moniliophthora roreri]
SSNILLGFICAGRYDGDSAMRDADLNGDLVMFGRWFLANPDLLYRPEHSLLLNPYDQKTFYVLGSTDPEEYINYPFTQCNYQHID